ncbi:DUF1697 domain-containing protein [Flavobacterium longum]|uniref:DUF1697 domain-containing protein n=1 Tax=Flavobacterium longum TaxID=1299340 RepID=UPI0039E85850
MTTHLVLLRGINVSGQKLIKMEDLRRLLADAGFENVVTYIQSGNIIFESEQTDKVKVAAQVKALIKKQYRWEVGVLALDLTDLVQTIGNNPFLKQPDPDLKHLYVAYLSEQPSADNLAKFQAFDIGRDEAVLGDRVLYLRYASGAGNTKLSNALIENKLKVVATSRNWNTTLKLRDMLSERS